MKWLVPHTMTVMELSRLLKQRLKVAPSIDILLMVRCFSDWEKREKQIGGKPPTFIRIFCNGLRMITAMRMTMTKTHKKTYTETKTRPDLSIRKSSCI